MAKVSEADSVFAGGGEMGALMRSQDWSQTPLGSVDTWPQSLKTSVRIMLTCRQPMFVWWGEDLINLYNDAYIDILGSKHPQGLGQPAAILWHEIWDQVGPRAESAMFNNEGTYDESLLLIMERNGFSEETYYTFSYSPVPNDHGGTGGIICANTEDTQRIVSQRQLTLLRELAAKTADVRTFTEACTLSAACLGANPYDLPFAMIYLVDPERQGAVLAGTSGIDWGQALSPETVAFEDDAVWPFAEVIASNQISLISELQSYFNHNNLPKGAWPRSPHQAVVVPILPSRTVGKAALLVVGLNPFRLFDDHYREFVQLIATQIAASLANAQAYEEERRRVEALAELDRAKTIFFNNVSHEFRTPLTLMLSPLDDLLSNEAETAILPSIRQSLELMQRNGQRLLKLVNTLLDFSRIEAGRIEVAYEPTDLALLTTELASVFRSAIEQAHLQLIIDCPPLSEPVYVDHQMWEKIVLNLLSNAFKFTFEGTISVSLRDRKDHIELAVQDTGTGIPADELPHIFERFHRVQGARGRTYEGSGIGLSLVQELVQFQGGTIHVSSVIDQGTCFTVSIPTGSAHLPREHIRAARTLDFNTAGITPYLQEALRWLPEDGSKTLTLPALHQNQSLVHSNNLTATRLLLVDDNTDMRDYVRRLLSDRGYTVETAIDGLMALSLIEQQAPDLVLTDVMMPRLDGFGLLQALRTDPKTRNIPVVLLSARAGEEARIEGLAAGADDYLVKPFSARELLARVEANLKMAQIRQEAAQREQALRMEAEAATRQLESIMSRIDDQFMALDREERYIYVNDRVSQVLGKPKEAFLGKRIGDLFPAVVHSRFYSEVQRAMTEQAIANFEYCYVPWQRWYEIRIYPSENGVSIFIADISDRKQAEAQLQEQELFLQDITHNVPVLLWTACPDGIMNFVSQSWIDYIGMDLETVNREGWQNLVHPDDLEDTLKCWHQATQTEQPYEFTHRLKRKDGEYHWCISRARLTYNEQGKPLRWVGSAVDIEHQKQIELTLSKTTELLKKGNQELDRFAYVVSHDLKAPLRAIANLSQWIEEDLQGQLPAENQQQLTLLLQRVYRMEALIDGLLAYSRADRSQVEAERVDVGHLIIEIIDSLSPPPSFRIEVQSGMPQLFTKRLLLSQVFTNLISNAIKHHDRSDGWVKISGYKSGKGYEFAVSDDGPGIDPKYHEKIFDIFQTLKAKDTQENTGIGLSIVKKIIETEGGQMQLESEEGRGATFRFTWRA